MNHHLPGIRLRRRIREALVRFFEHYQDVDFDAALDLLVDFYRVPRPKVKWYEYLDHGATLGETHADGRIGLIHPENWKQLRHTAHFQPSCANWIRTCLHEFHHVLYFVAQEDKADTYAARFVTGL